MKPLTRAEVREIDRRSIEEFGLPGIVLMENAGCNAAALLHERAPTARVAIVCGKGNNAGDGFVIARHLVNLGHVRGAEGGLRSARGSRMARGGAGAGRRTGFSLSAGMTG